MSLFQILKNLSYHYCLTGGMDLLNYNSMIKFFPPNSLKRT